MAKWPAEKLNQRLEDLRARLSRGETLEQIASAWGTTKQNVSQFRKRYLARIETPPSGAADPQPPPPLPETAQEPVGEDYALYARAYELLLAQDSLIQELQTELGRLRRRLHTAQQPRVSDSRAKESLKQYLETHD